MNCETYQEQISRLLDHELSIEEAQTTFAHLGTCPACTIFYTQAASIGARLRQGREAAYPQELDVRMRRAVETQGPARRGVRRFLPDRIRSVAGKRIVLPVPVAVLVLIVSLGLSIMLMRSVAPELLPVEKEIKIVVAYPPVEVVADQPIPD
jgi:anti-sigma factor RsiW